MGSKEIIRVEGDTNPVFIHIRRNGSAYDLTGATVTLYINRNLPRKPSDTPLTIVAAASTTNKATFDITAAVADLEPGLYYAEVKIVAADTTIWTASQFKWKVNPGLV